MVDIGSNSIRLVIFDTADGYPHPLYNERVFCALGADVGAQGRLPGKTIDKALAAIVRFARVAQECGAGPLRVFATSAVRDASNGGELIAAVLSQTGTDVDVISGDDEARLSAQAVLHGLNLRNGVVADLGGGSLELARVQKGKVGQVVSLPIGIVRLTAQTGGNLEDMRREVARQVGVVDWLADAAGTDLVPLGGAFRAFARLDIAENGHPLNMIHGYGITPAHAIGRTGVLEGLDARSLAALSAVPSRRRESLPLTAVILKSLIDNCRPSGVLFAAVGVREGYVYAGMPDREVADEPLLAGARGLAKRESRYGDTSAAIMDWLAPILPEKKSGRTRMQTVVCALADIAWREHPDYRAVHAFDRTIQYPFPGVVHADRAFIALAVYIRYGGRAADDVVTRYAALYSKRAIKRAEILGLALRLAFRISAGSPDLLSRSALSVKDGVLSLYLPPGGAAPDKARVSSTFQRLCEARKLSVGKIGINRPA